MGYRRTCYRYRTSSGRFCFLLCFFAPTCTFLSFDVFSRLKHTDGRQGAWDKVARDKRLAKATSGVPAQ